MFHRCLISLALCCLAGPLQAGTVVLVGNSATWRFQRGTNEASLPNTTTWRTVGFNDAAFADGPAPFWYGDVRPGGTQLTDMVNRYAGVFLRKTFTVSNVTDFTALNLEAYCDDGYIAWLNGVEVARYNVAAGAPTTNTFATGAITEPAPNIINVLTNPAPASYLVNGQNVLAIQIFNATLGSSDLGFDCSLSGFIDDVGPEVADLSPPATAIVNQLRQIDVAFSESVAGVNAADLLINGAPATNLVTFSPRDYRFEFPQPPTGAVQVEWVVGHGIHDLAPRANNFAGGTWTYSFDPAAIPAGLNISEFMADNDRTTNDVDGASSDWIEIHNPGAVVANLDGWFLTDDAANLTKWRFPSVNLGANSYLLVWASEKNRTNPASQLHTNFKLDSAGEFLALVDASTNVVSAFSPTYPAQPQTDVSYGRAVGLPDVTGFFATPTPGRRNTTTGAGIAPEVNFSLPGGAYSTNLSIVLSSGPGTTIRYTLNGSEPATNSTLHTAPIAITASTVVKARAFQTGLLPGPSTPQTYTILAADMQNFTSPLPIVVIDAFGLTSINDNSGVKKPVSMTFIERSESSGRSHIRGPVDAQTRAGIEVRGSSSAGFPKKSYSVELRDGSDNDLAAALLGMPAESDWVLYAPYTDKTFMNDYLAYELHEAMGHYAVRRRFVEVFLDMSGGSLSFASDYVGVYVLLEKIKIDKNRVNIAQLSPADTTEPAISGGYILKKDRLEDADDVPININGGTGFSALTLGIEDPKKLQVTQVQINWIQNYLNQFAAALSSATWTNTRAYTNYIDVDSFVDQHWMVEFAKNIDGYRLSNFMHKDRAGKLKMDPIWDWNLSFGNADYLQGELTNGWYHPQVGDGDYPWFRRLFQDPDFSQRYIDRWAELRVGILHPTNLQDRITRIAAEINEATARDYQRWPRMGSYIWPNPPGIVPITTFTGMTDWIKRWSNGRYYWIDSQFTRPPVLSHGGGDVTPGQTVSITAPAGTIYYTLDGTDPRLSGGGLSPLALVYSGALTINSNARIFARARSGANWSGPAAATFITAMPPLRVTEIMYHPQAPPAGNTNDADNFEFIEVKNIGATAINLNRFRFSGGIDFNFPDTSLGAGQSAVVVRHQTAFVSRYGAGATILGTYAGQFDNGSERVVLEGPMREPVLDFEYDDDWYPVTDGLGFSLVVVNDAAPVGSWALKSGWRPSGSVNGSPGASNAPPANVVPVVVSEALSHTDPPQLDAIELHNPTAGAANIGGWFLTDEFDTPKKFRIRDGTLIAANGYLVFNETNFNVPGNALIPFTLSSRGDDVYLFATDTNQNLTGYFHGFDFGAQANGRSFGRHVISTGADHFVAQSANSLGDSNAGPFIGPIVISEVMYHPADIVALGYALDNTDDEFIELQNISGATVELFDPAHPTNTWQLRDAVSFSFATNVTIPAGGRLLVVGFDPADIVALAAFRARNSVVVGVPIHGPFHGKLDNSGDSVELTRPDAPQVPPAPDAGFVPQILVDKVNYSDAFPWPAGADGFGPSLQRLILSAYGNEPTNWVAAPKSAGSPYPGGNLPVITQQPANRTVSAGSTVTFTVSVSGTGPFTYQWRYNGMNLVNATNAMLTLPGVQFSQAGQYQAVVFNPAGSISSAAAALGIVSGAFITKQPLNVTVNGDTNEAIYGQSFSNVTFSVVVGGSALLRYQWRFNGDDIALATNSLLVISNASLAHEGLYDVAITDPSGEQISDAARLSVKVPLIYVQVPANVTVAEGADVAVSAQARGNPMPITFSWRRINSSQIFTNIDSMSASNFTVFNTTASGLVLPTNILSANFGCRLVISNATSPPGQGVAQSFTVTVLADRDHDGMADTWELANGLSPTNTLDAALDLDGDGMSNWAEHIAGTEATNSLSYLRVDHQIVPGLASVQFVAVSNRTYTLEYTDHLGSPWLKLGDFFAHPTNRFETRTDLNWTARRYYRVSTPHQP